MGNGGCNAGVGEFELGKGEVAGVEVGRGGVLAQS